VDVPLLSSLSTRDCKSVCHMIIIHYSVLFISTINEFLSFSTALDGNVDIRTVTVQKVGLVF